MSEPMPEAEMHKWALTVGPSLPDRYRAALAVRGLLLDLKIQDAELTFLRRRMAYLADQLKAMTQNATSMTRLALAFADRIADQNEILSKRAERSPAAPCPYCEKGMRSNGEACAPCQATGVRHPLV